MNNTAAIHNFKAINIANRLRTRLLSEKNVIGRHPLTIELSPNEKVVVFRYGVIVFIDCQPETEKKFLSEIEPLLEEKLTNGNEEQTSCTVSTEIEEGGSKNNSIYLHDLSILKIQLVAEVLARHVMLEYFESTIGENFDEVENFGKILTGGSYRLLNTAKLLKMIGFILASKSKMLGRLQLAEKPDLIWDFPEIEKIYHKLDSEFELRERYLAIDEKLSLISDTATTILDVVFQKRGLKLEWIIIILILFEIVLTLSEKL